MNIQTTRFGELSIEPTKIITLDEGIIGFPDKRFILLTPQESAPFCWLQSVDNAALAFVVVDPAEFFPDYSFKITPDEKEKLMLGEGEQVVILVIVTPAKEPVLITCNLQGPVVINLAAMKAKQIVLEEGFTTRHYLFPEEAAKKMGETAKVSAEAPIR